MDPPFDTFLTSADLRKRGFLLTNLHLSGRVSATRTRDCRLANYRKGQERWKEISVDRLFAAKIVTSGESQGRPAHYLHS